MAIEKYSRKAPLAKELRRDMIGNLIITGLVVMTLGFFSYLAYWVSPALARYLTTKLDFNEYYAGIVIGFIFICSSVVLFVIMMILDGDERRIQTLIYKHTSRMVVSDYYNAEDAAKAAGKFRGRPEPSPPETSIRAAASVRPQASAIEEDYKSGKIDGAFKEFYPNGLLKRDVRYMGGKMNGLFRTYYENGQVEQEGYYRNDLFDGLYRSYYDNGTLHQEKEYIEGKLNGVYKAIDEQGIPFFEISYKHGRQHGEDKTYDQSGVLQYMDTYVNGIRVNRKTYNEYGILTFDQDFDDAIEEVERIAAEEERAKERETQERQKRQQKKVEDGELHGGESPQG